MTHPSVALLGSRGIPARYGGYETLLEELAPRLVARGFRVTVYGRTHAVRRRVRRYRGAEIVLLPCLRGKHLDTPSHTLLSLLDARARGFAAALVVNSANALFLPLLTGSGVPVALNVDGIEKRRAKWGRLGRAVYALSERLACTLPDALVTDAEVIHDHYLARYGAPYAGRFIRSFTEGADPRILFPGPIYGPGYRELLSHARAYVQATEVGGTHPALVEAMGYGNCVLAHDTPEHREVAGECARYFRVTAPGELAAALEWARQRPEEARALGALAAARAADRFSWERVADRYAALLGALARGGRYNTGLVGATAATDA